MNKLRLTCYCLLIVSGLYGQSVLKTTIADSLSRQGLPFATVRIANSNNNFIAGINGHISITLPSNSGRLIISYTGYKTLTIDIAETLLKDTIFLVPSIGTLGEVIVRPDFSKLRRIINTAINNKSRNNPELYDLYQCNIYYKMKTDLVPSKSYIDSFKVRRERNGMDTGFQLFKTNSHLLVSEVFSKRNYRKPQQLQETVIASRFSGLQKTYFTSLVTDVLPFHIYSDYINLNGKDYSNPVAKGWQQRYSFRLEDELVQNDDTTFVLSYRPKSKVNFNGLEGRVYINTKGYAISHFIGKASDTIAAKEVKIEQIYSLSNGKWFPQELNYELLFTKYPLPDMGLRMTGHSIIDSVRFTPDKQFYIDKAYSVKLGDSIDLHSEQRWKQLRMDTLTTMEYNTYRVMDSLGKKAKIDDILYKVGKLSMGTFPVGAFDLDLTRVIATNKVESVRLGAGFYSNELISKKFSAGGWTGYGFKDKVVKYGGTFKLFPGRYRDQFISISYQKNYQTPGVVRIHPELDRTGFRQWTLNEVDEIREVSLNAHAQFGYWELLLNAANTKIEPKYDNQFLYNNIHPLNYELNEASIGIRFAYGEKRRPAFGNYLPGLSKYPVVYLKSSIGKLHSGSFNNQFIKTIASISYRQHINRWGNDIFRLEGGVLYSLNDKPFPKSLLLAGNGFNTGQLNFYAWGGFITLRPFEQFNEKYTSLLYRHDFDRFLWQKKYSKPFISLAHNLLYGWVSKTTKLSTPTIQSSEEGYHESGLILNQLLQFNLVNAINLYVNAGAFYHWKNKFDWSREGVFVLGLSAGF